MNAAFRINLQVSAGPCIDTLKSRYYLPGRNAGQIDLAKCEAKAAISTEMACRRCLSNSALQLRALGQDQVMIGGVHGLGNHRLDDLHHNSVHEFKNWQDAPASPLPAFVDTGTEVVDRRNVDDYRNALASVQ